jgi:hypothetical protein
MVGTPGYDISSNRPGISMAINFSFGCHVVLDNLTPADVYFGREKGVLSRREQIKDKTLSERRTHHFNAMRVYNVQ